MQLHSRLLGGPQIVEYHAQHWNMIIHYRTNRAYRGIFMQSPLFAYTKPLTVCCQTRFRFMYKRTHIRHHAYAHMCAMRSRSGCVASCWRVAVVALRVPPTARLVFRASTRLCIVSLFVRVAKSTTMYTDAGGGAVATMLSVRGMIANKTHDPTVCPRKNYIFTL